MNLLQSKSIVALAVLFGASAAYAAPVETIDKFFSPQGKKVTEATYPSAESARQYLQEQSAVGVNNFNHRRVLTPTDKQTVVRMNRDTYYSFAVVERLLVNYNRDKKFV